MLKRTLNGVIILAIILSFSSSMIIAVQPPDNSSYRKLIDYIVADGSFSNGFTYGTNIEISDYNLPKDNEVTYNGNPTLRVNITGPSQWWESMLTVRNWCSHDLTAYLDNGYIEITVLGNVGNESFNIGLKDNKFSRNKDGNLEESAYVSINDYITPSKEWQTVQIPLKDFINVNPLLDLKYITCVLIAGSNSSAQKFWISSIVIKSPDLEQSYPEIKVNQIGFTEKSEKYALVSGFPEELTAQSGDVFHVVDFNTNQTVYTGKLSLITIFDEKDSGETVLKADFTELHTKGKYYIKVDAPNIAPSVSFTISNDVYHDMLIDVLRFFYYQRQGDLDTQYAGLFAREDVTPDDFTASFESNPSKILDVSKGWYDAGDLGKYVNVGSIAASDLLWTYEKFSNLFTDSQSLIPESGNGIPDILDEVRWEIEWILSMQDSESGGFYPRVQGDGSNRFVKDLDGCTTDDTACAAAVLAETYITFKNIDTDFANKCLNAAKRAWIFLLNNPNNISTTAYTVFDDSMDRLWASAALFRATADNIYHDYFKNNYTKTKQYFESSYAYGNVWGRMWFTAILDYLKAENYDPSIKTWISDEFDIWLEIITDRWENNAWGNTLHQGNYYWGVNMQIVNIPMAAILASEILEKENDTIKSFSLSTLSWILGANPMQKSLVTGEGENSIQSIYSTIFSNDDVESVPPGFMPGGPNSINGKGLSNFAAKCYSDNDNDWVTNEHTVYMNSPLVFLIAYAHNLGLTDSSEIITGDINDDNIVDVNDLIILVRLVNGYDKTLASNTADINNDFKINSFDVVFLKKILLNI